MNIPGLTTNHWLIDKENNFHNHLQVRKAQFRAKYAQAIMCLARVIGDPDAKVSRKHYFYYLVQMSQSRIKFGLV